MVNRSPRYPTYPLSDAVEMARKIHNQDRRYSIDREVAMKHMGYSPMSGSANKAMASLTQYGLLEKGSKSQIQLTNDAENIILGDDIALKNEGLIRCAYSPPLFRSLQERFKDGTPSSEALRSHLIREGYTDSALAPAIKAYLDTLAYLEQEKATESHGASGKNDEESPLPSGDNAVCGGAKIGDLVQWESQGTLQFKQPMRVRAISDDGEWIAVEGSKTGIKMSEVTVEQDAPSKATIPPVMEFDEPPKASATIGGDEKEWIRTPLGKGVFARILVTDDLSDAQIEKLRIILEAMKED